jgi:hypothetical protein
MHYPASSECHCSVFDNIAGFRFIVCLFVVGAAGAGEAEVQKASIHLHSKSKKQSFILRKRATFSIYIATRLVCAINATRWIASRSAEYLPSALQRHG